MLCQVMSRYTMLGQVKTGCQVISG